jgi:hypothetical protein
LDFISVAPVVFCGALSALPTAIFSAVSIFERMTLFAMGLRFLKASRWDTNHWASPYILFVGNGLKVSGVAA